jgi:hypothetical protein
MPGTEHEKQLGQPAIPQHTWPTQWPLLHCGSLVQEVPFSRRLPQVPEMQDEPAMQSPSPPQLTRQPPPLHRKGLQACGVCTHAPVPLQKPVGVYVDPAHEEAPHTVVAGVSLHAPAPLQVPVRPHGGAGTHRSCGSASSAATSLHVPS